MSFKKFKDPVYGYIEIDNQLISQIIDTANFQRLRDIIQTSYSPLYTSAVHNRFTHSLGVYHLGRIAARAFENSCSLNHISSFHTVKDYLPVFEIACLLHDVGHAPFSHTGEDFYFDNTKHEALHKIIISLTDDALLPIEISKNSYKAAAHELMSVIVGLNVYGAVIEKSRWSFFARCITGYKYTESLTDKKQLLNCLIELLNSSMIDVDKLDYLIRDAYMTGFENIRIDYIRLLESIYVFRQNAEYRLCYYKTAVSVIENVVYARDAERKWLQNHPAVLYEAYLLQNILSDIIETCMKKTYIPYDCLTNNGLKTESFGIIRLLSDSDIIYFMKNLPCHELAAEYLDRSLRKHPIWKTEAEYQAIFSGNEEAAQTIEREFADLKKELNGLGYSNTISQNALAACRMDARQLELEYETNALPQLKMSLRKRKRQIQIMEALYHFADRENLEFNFTIISTKQFNSGFGKPEFSKISMVFPEIAVPCEFGSISHTLKASESTGENFFYIYYTRKELNQKIHISELIKELLNIAYEIAQEQIRSAAERNTQAAANRLK